MANSSFQKNNPVPIPVSEGGTGVTSLTSQGVLIGAGSNDVTTVSPGNSGNILTSNGTSWTSSSAPSPSDGSITYPKIAADLTQFVDLGTSNIVDWSLGGIYNKILNSNTAITFINYKVNKSIVLKITGDYALTFPNTVRKIIGTYDGKVANYIFLHCTKSTAQQEVLATINQKTLNGYGYFAGGDNNTSTYYLITDRIVFSTGAVSANTVSNLSQARTGMAGVSDISTYGYFAGGWTGNYVSTADRIIFSTAVTAANATSNLSQTRKYLIGLSDGLYYGYFSGGNYVSQVTTTDRIVFSTGVTSANTISNLSQGRESLAGVSDGLSYGYFSGGSNNLITDRIVFSTGVTSVNTVSNLSQVRTGVAGLSDGVLYGYFTGGWTGGYSMATDRIVFSTGVTSANTVSNLSLGKQGLAGLSDGTYYGYFAGGYTGGVSQTFDRIVFSTGVTSAASPILSQSRHFLSGLSDCAV